MVAKSYQNLEIVGEPFTMDKGRMYVQVRMKNGNLKTVRWYSEKEYAKMYPEAKIQDAESTVWTKTQKEALGFEKGYITIIKGDTTENEEWYRMSAARYARWWGWYFISSAPLPADIPNETIQLPWELVGGEDGKLFGEAQVKAAIESLQYEASPSTYQGSIGDRIEVTVTIKKVIAIENGFGTANMHIMIDAAGNEYVWTTSAKCWATGDVKTIRGSVKDHRSYKNICQTILTRCAER